MWRCADHNFLTRLVASAMPSAQNPQDLKIFLVELLPLFNRSNVFCSVTHDSRLPGLLSSLCIISRKHIPSFGVSVGYTACASNHIPLVLQSKAGPTNYRRLRAYSSRKRRLELQAELRCAVNTMFIFHAKHVHFS
jgi:hypothetical protein